MGSSNTVAIRHYYGVELTVSHGTGTGVHKAECRVKTPPVPPSEIFLMESIIMASYFYITDSA